LGGFDDGFDDGFFLGSMMNDEGTQGGMSSKLFDDLPCCPICGSGKIQFYLTSGGKDRLTCLNCGDRWHIYVGGFWAFSLRWAELEMEADDGREKEFLGKRLEKDELRRLALEKRKTLREQHPK